MGQNGAKSKAEDNMPKAMAEYITSPNGCTLKEVAAKYGLSQNAVRNASHFQGWAEMRRRYREEVIRSSIQLSRQRDTTALDIIVSTSIETAKLVQEFIKDPDSLKRYVGVETVKEGGSMTTKMAEYTFRRQDMSQLKQAVDSLRSVTDGLYKLWAIPTQAEAESQRIASSKMELEWAKFEADQEAKTNDKEDVVIRLDVPEELDV